MRVTGRTRLLTVIGDPVAHSLSPSMHNMAIAALGIDAVYVAVRVPAPHLDQWLQGNLVGGVAGNVTVPHKVTVAGMVAGLTPSAEEVGAVNTFWSEDGIWWGDNTDVTAIVEVASALEAEGPWLIVGTGGSSRAAVAAAARLGLASVIRSRSAERASSFVAWGRERGFQVAMDEGQAVCTVVNATPIGLGVRDGLPVPRERIADAEVALDLVYRPGGTPWVNELTDSGKRAIDGRAVLVAQGAQAFERFFPGVEAPRGLMRAAIDRALRG